MKNLGPQTKPPTGLENYDYLKLMETGKYDNILLYDNKDFVATIEAMHKMIDFCNDNGIDMLRLG